MLTKTELIAQLVAAQVRDAQKRDQERKTGYGDRIRKAGEIVLAGGATDLGGGEYEVRSQTKKDKVYVVNGSCPCEDAVNAAPAGLCKHRMSAVIDRRIQQYLGKRRAICHAHRYVCTQHTIPEIDCWEQSCADPIEIPCPICAKANPNVPAYVEQIIDEEAVPTQDYTVDPEPEEKPTMMTSIGSVIAKVFNGHTNGTKPDGYIPEPEPDAPLEMEPETEHTPVPYTIPEYEEAPVLTPKLEPLPEAGASLNIKVRVDNFELMYTMRGHADREVLERLPTVLATLERLMKTEVDHDESFLKRLMHAFFPKPSKYSGK